MEFLVQFDLNIPDGISSSEIKDRVEAEASAFATLADRGVLVRLWRLPAASDESKLLGLYRAETDLDLDEQLHSLPFAPWMHTSVIQLESHGNDPLAARLTAP